ncbi:MAG: hypothetical protein DWQ06_16290 [Calditrichaeota bacterium]|nr:MAG: hypothetical protein DWQ06_16290 [Calditrichota bacterium]
MKKLILNFLLLLVCSSANAQSKFSTASFYTFGNFSGENEDSDEFSQYTTLFLPNYTTLILGYDFLKYPSYEQDHFVLNYRSYWKQRTAFGLHYFRVGSPETQLVNSYGLNFWLKEKYFAEFDYSYYDEPTRNFSVYQSTLGYKFWYDYFPHTVKLNLQKSPYNLLSSVTYSSFYEMSGFGMSWGLSYGKKQFFVDSETLLLENNEDLENYSLKFQPYYNFKNKLKISYSYKFKNFDSYKVHYNTFGVKITL